MTHLKTVLGQKLIVYKRKKMDKKYLKKFIMPAIREI